MIFTGGEDVDPGRYSQKVGKYTHSNPARDDKEFAYLYPEHQDLYFLTNVPKLGICRGAQLLTVINNGKLIQHVEGHKNNEQVIETNIGSNYIISSDHHQMMNPFGLSKKEYELIAWSKNFQSTQYLNGSNENIKLPKNFLEPEIIYYPYTKSLCIQPHPEWCIGTSGSNYCYSLIKTYLLKNKDKREDWCSALVDYSVPPGLTSIPYGWHRTGSDGNSYTFDGQSFILSSEFNYNNSVPLSEDIIYNTISIDDPSRTITSTGSDKIMSNYVSFIQSSTEEID
jgi:hypothetical protein